MKHTIDGPLFIKTFCRYLESFYCDLTPSVTPESIIWYRNGHPVAGVYKSGRYLCLSKDFLRILEYFSLDWNNQTDKELLNIIIPLLKLKGGTPAIPFLQELGFIDEFDCIGIPSKWD